DDTAIAEAAALINKAERPMILVGQGVVISGATESLRLLADKASIPVCSTLLGLSAMPSEHRLMKGMLGMHGNIGPNVNTNRADLIIAVGMRFDDRVTGNTAAYAPQAKIIHIDIDPSEFDKTVRSTIAINADARQALERLLPMIDEADHSDWIGSFDRHNDVEREKVVAVELKRPEGSKLTMGEVISKISDATGHRAVAVTDVGQNQMMSARYFKFTSPRSFISSGGLGTMGFGLPAAIGAKIAAPERTVCLFCGDGGFQMTIQELGTIMEYEVGVKMVILNNNFLGNVRQWQNLFYQRRFSQTPMMNPDFIKIASAYGIQGEDVIDRERLDGAISRMLADDRPYLLNVQIDETDMVFPMTPAGQAVDHVLLSADCPYNPNQD
ncbi:MAG: thiamine pyrophosphate-binding protein, partial [Muribaculaceae bacterium]|nr:thiamine pyrophosphate-binding protein [Muribaculaceae bacterium]